MKGILKENDKKKLHLFWKKKEITVQNYEMDKFIYEYLSREEVCFIRSSILSPNG